VFLRPASQKPLFGKKGASQEAIRRRAGIPSQDTDKGLRWLSRIGLLRQGTHARVESGGFSLILNPTGSPAKEIAQLMLQIRWTIEQKGVLIHKGP